MRCHRCDSDDWRPYGTTPRRGAKVARYQCRLCGRVQVESADTMAYRRARRSVGSEALVERFFRLLPGKLGLGLREASVQLGDLVGVHRTTVGRWLDRASLGALPSTGAFGTVGRDFARECLRVHRMRHHPCTRFTLVGAPSPSSGLWRDADQNRMNSLWDRIVRATLQACAITPFRVPSWLDRHRTGQDPARGLLGPSRLTEAQGLVDDIVWGLDRTFPADWWEAPLARAWRDAWRHEDVRDWLTLRGYDVEVLAHGEVDDYWGDLPHRVRAWIRGASAPQPIDDRAVRRWMDLAYLRPDSNLARAFWEAFAENSRPDRHDLRSGCWNGAEAWMYSPNGTGALSDGPAPTPCQRNRAACMSQRSPRGGRRMGCGGSTSAFRRPGGRR